MRLFRPDVYQKSIFEINYSRLKELCITCLVFDLDNTLGKLDHKKSPYKVKELIRSLQNDFLVLICSNNTRRRVEPFFKDLGIGGVYFSFKPTTLGLAKIKRRYRLKKKEMCIIGDQMVTDILAGNRFHIMTVLVDPMSEKELMITGVNREIESRIIRRYQKRGVFERGKYYE